MDSATAPKHICTCGHRVAKGNGWPRKNGGMEASFVHLALPTNVAPPSLVSLTETTSHHASHEGFLETVRHASALLRAGQGNALPQGPDDEGVSLCQDCINRYDGVPSLLVISPCIMCLFCRPFILLSVSRAIEADTERLEEERMAYNHAVTAELERVQNLEAALRTSHWSPDVSASQIEPNDLIQRYERLNRIFQEYSYKCYLTPWFMHVFRTEESFRQEIAILSATCEQHEQELAELQKVQAEQARLSKELDTVDDYLEDERNRLEIDADAFGHVQQQLSRTLGDLQREIESLSNVRLHSVLFNLVVDNRGLRYPLINELRLAYRPKGDVHWTEISAAWAQAAQLLLLVAASVKFRSKDWRIVPLTTCAKLIHIDGKHRSVYTLGGNDRPVKMALSLRAMNALLDQLCRHMILLGHDGARPMPYETTRNRIGRFELSQLDENNDSGWSSVVHCMASNMQWLSDRASDYELQHATTVAK